MRLVFARALLVLDAMVWLAIAVATMGRPSAIGSRAAAAVIAVLMVGNAAAFVLCSWSLGRAGRWLALGVLIVNLVLTFADEFGLLDVVTGLLGLAIVALLLWPTRRAAPAARTRS